MLADATTAVRRHGANIATEAGMSTMNVYSRFGGKDGVIDELYIDGFSRLYEAIGAVPTTDDFATDLVAMAQAYRQFALENPTYYKVMFRTAIHEFAPSAAAGQVRTDDGHDARVIAAWLWATCHGLVTLEIFSVANEQVDWSAVYDRGIRTSVEGLSPASISHG